MNDYSAIPIDSIDVTRDLQARLARFARATFVVAGMMLVGALVAEVALRGASSALFRPSRLVHAIAQLEMLAVWQLCRRKSALSVPVLHTLDATLTITLGLAWAVLGVELPTSDPIEFTMILATSFTLIARAVSVPSTYLRTFVISTLTVLPTIAVFVHRGANFVRDRTPEGARFFLILS